MDDDETPTDRAAERIAVLNARRTTGCGPVAPGARRATLLASVVAVAGLTGGFALNAENTSTASVVAASKAVATTNTTTAATTATTTPRTATTTQSTTAQAVTTSQGS